MGVALFRFGVGGVVWLVDTFISSVQLVCDVSGGLAAVLAESLWLSGVAAKEIEASPRAA